MWLAARKASLSKMHSLSSTTGYGCNASVIYDLGSTGFLGVGSVSGLDDNTGRLRMLFAEEDEGEGTQVSKVEWGPSLAVLPNNTIVWNGGPPSKDSSWNVSTTPTPGDA